MLRTTLSALLALALLGCSGSVNQRDEEGINLRRLGASFDGIRADLLVNSNLAAIALTNWPSALSRMSAQGGPLRELLTKGIGGADSVAILTTNARAWVNPQGYAEEIAVVFPQPIQKDGRIVFMGMQFSGKVIYFTGVSSN